MFNATELDEMDKRSTTAMQKLVAERTKLLKKTLCEGWIKYRDGTLRLNCYSTLNRGIMGVSDIHAYVQPLTKRSFNVYLNLRPGGFRELGKFTSTKEAKKAVEAAVKQLQEKK